MTVTESSMPGVTARFQYLQWQDLYEKEKPFEIFINLPSTVDDQRQSNLVFEDGTPEYVENARDSTTSFDLDVHGFTFKRHRTLFTAWHNRDAVETDYFPDLEQFLKQELPGADRVVFFDWRVGGCRHSSSTS